MWDLANEYRSFRDEVWAGKMGPFLRACDPYDHLTRAAAGNAKLYTDGQLIAAGNIAGELSSWDEGFRLALANELTHDRAWLGEYQQVALYDRALSSEEVGARFHAGPRSQARGAVVLYTFEGDGDWVRDVSGEGEPLDLQVADPGAVSWLQGGGLEVRESTLIASAGPATRITQAVRASGSFTLEAWVRPANTTQAGPARLVTLSRDTGARNFTLGQNQEDYLVRFRTSATSENGEPPLASAGAASGQPRVMGLRHPSGELAIVYLPVGGTVGMRAGALQDGLTGQWYNPRTGAWSTARPDQAGRYTAPDQEDWVLRVGR